MPPSTQKRRGEPDLYTAPPPAARRARRARRYRLLLTRLPGRWELIIFDRDRGEVMRRLEGPVVKALREMALPPELVADGVCDADKALVLHIFLASAAIAVALEGCEGLAQTPR